MNSRTPLIIAIVLLLLPVLYVGSYFALLSPRPSFTSIMMPSGIRRTHITNYRVGTGFLDRFFWPVEEIDRRVRSPAWMNTPRGRVWQEN